MNCLRNAFFRNIVESVGHRRGDGETARDKASSRDEFARLLTFRNVINTATKLSSREKPY
jgi:hypothetical protein